MLFGNLIINCDIMKIILRYITLLCLGLAHASPALAADPYPGNTGDFDPSGYRSVGDFNPNTGDLGWSTSPNNARNYSGSNTIMPYSDVTPSPTGRFGNDPTTYDNAKVADISAWKSEDGTLESNDSPYKIDGSKFKGSNTMDSEEYENIGKGTDIIEKFNF